MSSDRLRDMKKASGEEPLGSSPSPKLEIQRFGISASPGIVIGRAFLKDSELLVVPRKKLRKDEVETEIEKLQQILEVTREELLEIKSHIADQMGDDHAKIFDAHMMILEDVLVVEDTVALIRKEQMSAAAAFQRVINRVMSSFGQIKDEYLKDRYVDIKDVKRRVLRHLLGRNDTAFASPVEPSIIVAHDLAPSDTAQLQRELTLGYATDLGGSTSHTAILARSQGVPAVVGLEELFKEVETGDTVIVDGNTGCVIVNPTEETLEDYQQEIQRFKELEDQLLTLTGYPATTLDDKEYGLAANLDLPQEVESVHEYGGQGVGLFRTEYFFISQNYLPSEDVQFEMYKSVVSKMGGKPVIFRTIDIGDHPRSVFAGDVDGDGLPDLLTANEGDDSITLVVSDGTGAYGPPLTYSVGRDPRYALAGDMDGDGDLDLLSANHSSHDFSLFVNQTEAEVLVPYLEKVCTEADFVEISTPAEGESRAWCFRAPIDTCVSGSGAAAVVSTLIMLPAIAR